jgi:hypothetical protein
MFHSLRRRRILDLGALATEHDGRMRKDCETLSSSQNSIEMTTLTDNADDILRRVIALVAVRISL